MALFKAIIRVVKSLSGNEDRFTFGEFDIAKEPIIEAADKTEVKKIISTKYPQFFPSAKVYEKETKDTTQFFYAVIFPLHRWEIDQINSGEWVCASCGQMHENRYISKPRTSRLFGDDILFCKSGDNGELCLNNYKKDKYKNIDFPDDTNYIKSDSPNYIYKVTEKETGKSYIGKTRNAPFFRWWNHLTHSSSPFGVFLRKSKLSDWTFEVLEELPAEIKDSEVFRVESEYMVKFDSINNGFNSMISSKEAIPQTPSLFHNQ